MRTKLRNDRKRLRILEEDTLPRPLQRSAPREVVLNSSGWVAAIGALALLLGGVVGGPLLALKLIEDSKSAVELRSSGIPAHAVVTEVRRSRDNKSQTTVRYRYAAAGQQYVKSVQLRRDDPTVRTVATGSPMQVLYLPSEPGRSWPQGYGPREQPVWVSALLPTIGIPGAVLIAFLLQRQKRLLEDGRAAIARIISTEKRSKHQDIWRVTYSWSLLNGAVRTAHVDRDTDPTGAGSYVAIVYDPDRPRHHSVYPLSLVKIR